MVNRNFQYLFRQEAHKHKKIWSAWLRFFCWRQTDKQANIWTEPMRKGKGQDTCYSTAYMSQTLDQQHFYNLGSGS